jgi:hypothetical protein
MKKLLALILCVMMFVAVIPTAAFAEGTTGGTARRFANDMVPNYLDKGVAANAITDLNKDLTALYTATVANETVFGSAKAIYDFTNGLATDLLKDTEKIKFPDGTTIYNEDLTANLRKALNHIIGNEVRNYMNDRVDAYTNTSGRIQPDKYLKVFAKALNNALASETAQKNIEELVLEIAVMNAQKNANDKADDLYDAIVDWDHWNEFNWGRITSTVGDPDGAYNTTWRPSAYMLIPTGSDDVVDTSGAGFPTGDAVDGMFALYGWFNNTPVNTAPSTAANNGLPPVWNSHS